MLQLPSFGGFRALVVGDVMLDRYWFGATSRISPEAPVPVVIVDKVEERPGGAANVAANMASLGVEVSIAGTCGTDEAADVLERLLTRSGIRCLLHRDAAQQTIIKLRVVSQHQQLIRLDFEKQLPPLECRSPDGDCRRALGEASVLVISDYGKGTVADPRALIDLAAERGIPVVVDPKGGDFERYRDASVLTPNLREFEEATGPCPDEATLLRNGTAVTKALRLKGLIVTLGERGVFVIDEQGAGQHLPARAREVYDVTGAGDTVVAVLAAALASGTPLVRAAYVANQAGGLAVSKFGTGALTAQELQVVSHPRHAAGSRILSEEQLMAAVREARMRGETVVMTNGCFDILHEGHVAMLEQARMLGDRLIVAVNADASVRRLKGAGRPINPLQRRTTVLAGLSSVDWIVPFEDDTPEQLICAVRPHVLVKGGDYRLAQIAGRQCVTDAGGEVIVLDRVAGASTSAMIDAIRNG